MLQLLANCLSIIRCHVGVLAVAVVDDDVKAVAVTVTVFCRT